MPLRYTGEKTGQVDVRYSALGNQDEPITLIASLEILQDNGEDAVLQKGSDKYDLGMIDGNVVIVRANDF